MSDTTHFDLQTELTRLPFYMDLTPQECELLSASADVRTFDKGTVLHDRSTECLGLVRVLSGRARTTMTSPDGREVTIYSLGPGDDDVLTATCVVSQITFDSAMVTDERTQALVVPAPTLRRLRDENVYVRCWLYELSTRRFSDAMWTMQQILFMRADQRVASGLLDEYARTGTVRLAVTQDQLARSISSAREVVSRVLKRMEADGLLRVGRGCIELVDLDGLYRVIG